MSFDL